MLTVAGGAFPETLPDWMNELNDLGGLVVRQRDEDSNTVTEEDADQIRRTTSAGPEDAVLRIMSNRVEKFGSGGTWEPLAPYPGADSVEVGLGYNRVVETLPFVARKATGTSSRIRKMRIMDVSVDFTVEPALYESDLDAEDVLAELDAVLTIIPPPRKRAPKARRAKRVYRDTDAIMRVHFKSRGGWRDRVAFRIESDKHVAIAGLAYRAVA